MNTLSVHDLMRACIQEQASDIHLSVGAPPKFRRNTQFNDVEGITLTGENLQTMMKEITPGAIQEEYARTGSGDFSFQFEDGTRFRVAVFKQKGSCALVLRRIPHEIIPLEKIGLPEAVFDICNRPRGLFLVTGPTGSGKTTTLAALIDYINTNQGKHILTLEDPIEYKHDHKRSLVNQRQIGEDVPSFTEGLRRGLRQDPDIILIGEMRDLETMRAAVSAAETGHLVFATLHTLGASASVNRIIDAFPTEEKEHMRVQLAGSLIGVLSQTLCPRLDQTGIVAAYEFLYVTFAIQAKLRDMRPFGIDDDIQSGARYGMQLLDIHLQKLVMSKAINFKVAQEKSRDPLAMTEWGKKMQLIPHG